MNERADQNNSEQPNRRTPDDPESGRETIPPKPPDPSRSHAPPGSIPKTLGRYRIERPLGQGAMGSVYLAHDTKLGRQVALKIPLFRAEEGSEFKQRFYREARSAATLNHRNICAVYDIGEIDGTPYISMAYIEGRPLAELVYQERAFSGREIAALVRTLALALAEAHRRGVIHRDLKPANVIIDTQGEPVLMDFGLARQINRKEDERLTQSGALLGSPAYMSPEQVEGDRDLMGPASDVYSLGVMIYELLTSQLPFQGSIAAVIGQIITSEPEKPSAIRPDVDPRLEALCLKMMAKTIADRPQSMQHVAAILERFLKKTDTPENKSVSMAEETAWLDDFVSGSPNIAGLDLARGLAVLGMIVVNFKLMVAGAAAGVESDGIGEWVRWGVDRLHGRAAAVFVLLAGIAVALASNRARLAGDARAVNRIRGGLLFRAVILIAVGYLNHRLWPGDLLHFIGVYLAVGVLLLTTSGRVLLTFAILLVLFFVGLYIGLGATDAGYYSDWDVAHMQYSAFWTPLGTVRHLFFNGFYPVVPWVAFFLFGMWLGRLDLRRRTIRNRLLWIALAAALVTELLSAVNVMVISSLATDNADYSYKTIVRLFGTTPIPPLPLFMLAAGSTAVAVLAACLILADRANLKRLLSPLGATGHTAVTLYVAHVLLGMGTLQLMGRLGGQTPGYALVASLIFCATSVLFAWAWQRRYENGPLESVLRKVGG